MKKNLFLIFVGILFLISGALLLVAQTGEDEVITESFSGEETADISHLIGPDLEPGTVSVQNVNFEKKDGVTTLDFTAEEFLVSDKSKNSNVKISDNEFPGIISKGEDFESFVKVDENGELLEAQLLVNNNKNVMKMKINGEDVVVPGGSKVFYKDGELRIDQGKSDYNVRVANPESYKKITYEGDVRIGLDPNDKNKYIKFEHGDRLHYDGKNYYVEAGDAINYNGVSFNPKDRVNFYFGDEIPKGTAGISLGDNSFSFACGDNPDIGEIVLSGNSPYYRLKDVEGGRIKNGMYVKADLQGSRMSMTKRDLKASFTEPDSSMTFFDKENGLDKNIPTIECDGGYQIETGKINLINTEGRVRYLRNAEAETYSREVMIVDTTNEKYNKLIQTGPNSNMRLGVLDKDQNWALESSFDIVGDREGMNAINLYMLDDNPELFGLYEFGSADLRSDFLEKVDYTSKVQAELNEKMIQKYPELEGFFEEYGGSTNMFEMNKALAEMPGDYYLTMDERDAIVSKYPKYWEYSESLKDMTIYYETTGIEEGTTDSGVMQFLSSEEQLWGLRMSTWAQVINSDEYIKEYNEALNKVLERFGGRKTTATAEKGRVITG